MKSFVFTLKNPHHLAARTFSLQADMKQYTMQRIANSPMVWFGNGGAIGITDNCDSHNNSHNRGFGIPQSSFVNDTGLPGSTLLTGEEIFTVKEFEIFEVSI
jgi:hypothetical protein